MKTYTILYAEDVPHYGTHDIKAENDQAAIAAAVALHTIGGVSLTEASWGASVYARIVHIEDPDGNIIAQDQPLDDGCLVHGSRANRSRCDTVTYRSMTMALRLLHGRDTPDEAVRGVGYDGPSLAGVAYVHATYGQLRIGFDSIEAAHVAHVLTGWAFIESTVLEVAHHEDLITTKHMHNNRAEFSYFGDWEIINNRKEK